MTQAILDLNNLPSRVEAEEIIKGFDAETTLSYINLFRTRQIDHPDMVSEDESVIGIMLVRHLRTLRESKSRTKTAGQKAAAAVAPLSDLL
jgi:hypothetical protein